MDDQKTIMGIDPGTNVLGFGVILVSGNSIQLSAVGSVHMRQKETHYNKLRRIHEQLQQLLDLHKPRVVSIEAPFFGKNVQSMLKLGRAQGVAMAAALTRDIEVIEYSPKKIKQSITGNGNSSKEQVAAMLCQILRAPLDNISLDATDGLAAAVCYFFQMNGIEPSKERYGSWEQFISGNPQRVG